MGERRGGGEEEEEDMEGGGGGGRVLGGGGDGRLSYSNLLFLWSQPPHALYRAPFEGLL